MLEGLVLGMFVVQGALQLHNSLLVPVGALLVQLGRVPLELDLSLKFVAPLLHPSVHFCLKLGILVLKYQLLVLLTLHTFLKERS